MCRRMSGEREGSGMPISIRSYWLSRRAGGDGCLPLWPNSKPSAHCRRFPPPWSERLSALAPKRSDIAECPLCANSASLIASRLRLLRGPLARRAVKLQVGHDAGAGPGAGINDGLVGAAEHVLHGFEINPLPRHVRRLLVLFVNLREPRRLTLGFGDGLFAIGFGILGDFGGAAARFRHDPVV